MLNLYTENVINKMILIRYWQHLINEKLKEKKFKIPIHLSFGTEAIATCVSDIIDKGNKLLLTHRNISYNLAIENNFKKILDQYLLKNNDLMGSMNLANINKNLIYSSSVLGNNLPVAAGVAMSLKIKKSNNFVLVIAGDGAIEEGALWESLLFIKSHNLKVIIILENNNHSMSSTIQERRCNIDFKKICDGLEIQYFKNKGYDYSKVKTSLDSAIESAENQQPCLVEYEIKNFNQHAGPTPGWPEDPMKIDINEGLILKDVTKDPLFYLKSAIGDIAYKNKLKSLDINYE